MATASIVSGSSGHPFIMFSVYTLKLEQPKALKDCKKENYFRKDRTSRQGTERIMEVNMHKEQ